MMLVPADWKLANIVSIFKKGDKNSPENFQPISPTPVISKLLESTFNYAIINHLEKNGLLSKSQHGLRRNWSNETNLIQSYDIVTKLIEEDKAVDVLLLDHGKAFNKVVHKYLSHKLHAYGVYADIVEWIRSFLIGRIQKVMVDSDNGDPIFSEPASVISRL
ncbi:uncharacterized protein LOC136034871 [Artemia franciscana]|uniref:uncharacterized protein LOC136034871 n=1 Tax=Artemia franciscana TaxID=6661 RepID=UPI0032D9BE61